MYAILLSKSLPFSVFHVNRFSCDSWNASYNLSDVTYYFFVLGEEYIRIYLFLIILWIYRDHIPICMSDELSEGGMVYSNNLGTILDNHDFLALWYLEKI